MFTAHPPVNNSWEVSDRFVRSLAEEASKCLGGGQREIKDACWRSAAHHLCMSVVRLALARREKIFEGSRLYERVNFL